MKKIMVCLFLLLCVLLTSSCGQNELEDEINIGVMPTYSASIYAVGISKGFFEAEGLSVNMTVFKSATIRDSAAASGELDGFMTDVMGAINLNSKGYNFKITSSEYESFGVMSLSDINETSDELYRLGISENTIIDFIADQNSKASYEKVNIMAIPDRLAALMSGEIDQGIFPEPFISLIMAQGGFKLISTEDMGIQPVVMVFENELVEEDSEKLKAFYRGYLSTIEYMKSNPIESYQDTIVEFGLVAEEDISKLQLPLNKYGLYSPDIETYNQASHWMLEKTLIDEEIEFNQIATLDFTHEEHNNDLE